MSEKTIIKGLENGRAAFAYNAVEKAKSELKDKGKRYKAYVKKIPMLIKTNGLGSTFAFVLSKAKLNEAKRSDESDAYKMIYNQVSEWLRQTENKIITLPKEADLVKTLIDCESSEYRAVTVEVLSLFNWLRRLAEGLIEGEAKDE